MVNGRKAYLKKIGEHPVLVAVGSLSIPILAILWDLATDEVDKEVILYISLFIGAVAVSIIMMVQGILNSSLKEEFYSKISVLENFIESSGSGWISSEDEIAIKEQTADDITVITTDMKNDVEPGEICDSVSTNLEKGKKYMYILPKLSSTYALIEEFKRVHDFEKNQVSVIFIPEEHFYFLNEIVLYDLFNKKR